MYILSCVKVLMANLLIHIIILRSSFILHLINTNEKQDIITNKFLLNILTYLISIPAEVAHLLQTIITTTMTITTNKGMKIHVSTMPATAPDDNSDFAGISSIEGTRKQR